ncbi:MAG: hypothetical protein PHY00_02205 [Bacilli bacterium]|nr:hypothetical protein [Bacilli bacterium]
MKLVSAKCPNCGANLKLSKENENVICDYCRQTIIVDDAVACYKLKLSGTVSIEGIQSNFELINSANELLKMNEYLQAKRQFQEFTEKCPDNYQGWLGLLICRTRNFSIKDNNYLFENDVKKYHVNFMKTAPDEVKSEYTDIIDSYLHPTVEKQIQKKIKIRILDKIKEKKLNLNFISKINKSYIFSGILILCAFSIFINSCFISGTIWLLAGLVLIPKIKDLMNLSKNKAKNIAIILFIIGFFIFALESKYSFEKSWVSTNDQMVVTLEDNKASIRLNDGTTLVGEYTHDYNNDIYTIVVNITNSDDIKNMTFKYSMNYSEKYFCLYEDNECSKFFIIRD